MTALSRSLRFAESEVVAYRRTWRGTVISSFINPVFYLTAMGAALGTMVDRGPQNLGVPYLTFVATGLMAANAMQNGAGDGSFPVMAGVLWRKNFQGAITTPLGPADIVWGRLIWGAARLLFILAVFAVIAAAFGAVSLGPALRGVPPAILTGLAFTSVITAWTLTREDATSLSTLFRFGIVPLFLFSGTFFPVGQLPDFLQPVAYATPLFHGVELVRKVVLVGAEAPLVSSIPMWSHLGYLLAMTAAGVGLSIRFLDRRIRP